MSSYYIAKHPWLGQPCYALTKMSLPSRLDVLLSGVIRTENPNFECHRKYLVHALHNLRCVTVLHTSVKCRVWTQVQHIKWSSKLEFELESKNLSRVFRFEFKFKFGEILKDFQKLNWSTKSGFWSTMSCLSKWCPWMMVWSLSNHQLR
jgi:hypothetical protein